MTTPSYLHSSNAGIHSEIVGSGSKAIVLLHGWDRSLQSLKPLAELLAQLRCAHIVDLPGFGLSPPPDAVWSAFDYADAIARYMDDNAIASAEILGHSFGGKVALAFARRYPDRAAKLILIAAAGVAAPLSIGRRLKKRGLRYAAISIKAVDDIFSTTFFDDHFVVRYGSSDYRDAEGVMRSILVRSVNEDYSSWLPEVRHQTLLLWGERDRATPPGCAIKMDALLPHSQLHLFPFKDHFLPLDVGADLCAGYILPFLKDDDSL